MGGHGFDFLTGAGGGFGNNRRERDRLVSLRWFDHDNSDGKPPKFDPMVYFEYTSESRRWSGQKWVSEGRAQAEFTRNLPYGEGIPSGHGRYPLPFLGAMRWFTDHSV